MGTTKFKNKPPHDEVHFPGFLVQPHDAFQAAARPLYSVCRTGSAELHSVSQCGREGKQVDQLQQEMEQKLEETTTKSQEQLHALTAEKSQASENQSSTASTASAALARVVELENELQITRESSRKVEQLQFELEETQERLQKSLEDAKRELQSMESVKEGDKVVKMNIDGVDASIEGIVQVDIPASWASLSVEGEVESLKKLFGTVSRQHFGSKFRCQHRMRTPPTGGIHTPTNGVGKIHPIPTPSRSSWRKLLSG
eukprot:symbB.v1.2.017601.t1/scaffold1376.1/size122662/1